MINKISINYLILIIALSSPVAFRSGKFFDNLKDHAISDSVELHIMMVAEK
jgi:hypothetical protein